MWYNDGGCVLAHPDSANVVMTGGMSSGGYFGVSVSHDTGRTWTRFTLWNGYADVCFALATAPSQPRTVYAAGRGSHTGKVFVSVDLGRSWQRTGGAPAYEVYGLAVHPDDPATVVAACADGLYLTANSGTSWTLVNPRLGFRSARFISANDVAAGGDNGVFVSTDGGVSWADTTANIEGGGVTRLDFVRTDGTALLAGTRAGACWLLDIGVGVEEAPTGGAVRAPSATVVRGVLTLLRASSDKPQAISLLDAAGRKVADLAPGPNDVSRLAPGVYFVRECSAFSTQHSALSFVRKVIVQR
ncbi:hypothetical protein FJY71_08505 [candidate division WOR-3 bacterium]|nr:hypothetical protein [candidate division WOR-3 bacterium]